MELELEIETGESCFFTIKDLTSTSVNGYLPENSEEFEKDRFKYSDTVAYAIMDVHNLNNDKIVKHLFISHSKNTRVDIKTEFNGIFDFYYIVLPTKEWVDKNEQYLYQYKEVYYYEKGSIYRNSDKAELEVSDLISINSTNTTLTVLSNSMTSICFIKKHFSEICQLIYNKRSFSNLIKGSVCKDLVNERDLIWTIINLISYYTDSGNMYETQRMIEKYNKYYHPNYNSCNCHGAS